MTTTPVTDVAAVRANVVASAAARAAFCDGVVALKQEHLGITTAQLGMSGPASPVSTYDLFVVWHHLAMMRRTPVGHPTRNAAHSGPAFLPWHRLMLILLELQLQRVLGDPNVGLPYWDWATDGDLPPNAQPVAPLWTAAGIGGGNGPVTDGPFRPQQFRVSIVSDATGTLRRIEPRALRRQLADDALVPSLPTTSEVENLLDSDQLVYDEAQWDSRTQGFRNRLEGWVQGPRLHNAVHVWVGGDMGPASSPNDPVFFLNHCNVDRIWEGWMTRRGRVYAPPNTASGSLAGHRAGDALYSILVRQAVTPAQLLNASQFATYDALP